MADTTNTTAAPAATQPEAIGLALDVLREMLSDPDQRLDQCPERMTRANQAARALAGVQAAPAAQEAEPAEGFWKWVRLAYRDADTAAYTVHNMEIAFRAGAESGRPQAAAAPVPAVMPVAREYPCSACCGTGADGDVGHDGRVTDVACNGCGGSGKNFARVALPWPWKTETEVLHEAIDHLQGQERLKNALRIIAAAPQAPAAAAAPAEDEDAVDVVGAPGRRTGAPQRTRRRQADHAPSVARQPHEDEVCPRCGDHDVYVHQVVDGCVRIRCGACWHLWERRP